MGRLPAVYECAEGCSQQRAGAVAFLSGAVGVLMEVLSNPSFGMMASNLAVISFSFLPEISSCDGSDGEMYLSYIKDGKFLTTANLPLFFSLILKCWSASEQNFHCSALGASIIHFFLSPLPALTLILHMLVILLSKAWLAGAAPCYQALAPGPVTGLQVGAAGAQPQWGLRSCGTVCCSPNRLRSSLLQKLKLLMCNRCLGSLFTCTCQV